MHGVLWRKLKRKEKVGQVRNTVKIRYTLRLGAWLMEVGRFRAGTYTAKQWPQRRFLLRISVITNTAAYSCAAHFHDLRVSIIFFFYLIPVETGVTVKCYSQLLTTDISVTVTVSSPETFPKNYDLRFKYPTTLIFFWMKWRINSSKSNM